MILDTNVLIDLNSPYCPPRLRRKLAAMTAPPRTTAVNWAELMYGFVRRGSENRRRLFLEFVADLLPELEILCFGQECAEVLANLRAELEGRGQRLDTNDLMIASIALRHDLPLLTGNTRHFSRVPGLRVENWLADD